MARDIDELARDAAEEILGAWLNGENDLRSLRDEASSYITEPIMTEEIERLAKEVGFSVWSEVEPDWVGLTIESIMVSRIMYAASEKLWALLDDWGDYDAELVEMQDAGWKFSRNGSDLIALDPSGEQHTREWSLSAIQELYDEVYLPSLDEEENLEDEDA